MFEIYLKYNMEGQDDIPSAKLIDAATFPHISLPCRTAGLTHLHLPSALHTELRGYVSQRPHIPTSG